MKSLSQSYLNIIVLTIVVIGLVAYSFIDAQTWTAPTSAPPDGNVSTPLNVSATPQTKAGSLTVSGDITTPNTLGTNNLNVIGNLRFANAEPFFHWNDNDDADRDFYQYVNDNVMYFLTDRNNNGGWDAGDWAIAHPMTMYAGSTTTEDYVNFSNDVNAGRNVNAALDVNSARNVNAANYVWAPTMHTDTINALDINVDGVWASEVRGGWRMRSNAYCDEAGNNCFAPWQVGGNLNCTTRTISGWAARSAGDTISCQAGEIMTGGGCTNTNSGCGGGGCSDRGVISSHPSGNGWACDGSSNGYNTVYVRCCS